MCQCRFAVAVACGHVYRINLTFSRKLCGCCDLWKCTWDYVTRLILVLNSQSPSPLRKLSRVGNVAAEWIFEWNDFFPSNDKANRAKWTCDLGDNRFYEKCKYCELIKSESWLKINRGPEKGVCCLKYWWNSIERKAWNLNRWCGRCKFHFIYYTIKMIWANFLQKFSPIFCLYAINRFAFRAVCFWSSITMPNCFWSCR